MHVSVLYEEVLHWLEPKADGLFIDGTLGWGGHTLGLLQASAPSGHVLAFDRDQLAIEAATERLGGFAGLLERVTIAHASFEQMGRVAPEQGFGRVDGIVLDLGLSSMQLDNGERGFSFRFDAPLDMRFDQTGGESAADLLNNLSEQGLSEIFWRYGEERRSRQLARIIVDNRPILSTKTLADLIERHTPYKLRRRGHHPATKIFQALRIAVNDELGALERVLPVAVGLLKPQGRLAVISFHSLEDRIVKQAFRAMAIECICPPQQPFCTCDQQASVKLLKRKVIKASDAEIAANPRSRSARLRIIEKI